MQIVPLCSGIGDVTEEDSNRGLSKHQGGVVEEDTDWNYYYHMKGSFSKYD